MAWGWFALVLFGAAVQNLWTTRVPSTVAQSRARGYLPVAAAPDRDADDDDAVDNDGDNPDHYVARLWTVEYSLIERIAGVVQMVAMVAYTSWRALYCVPAALPSLVTLIGGPVNAVDAVVWLPTPRPVAITRGLALGGFLLLSLHGATFQLFDDLDSGANDHGDGPHVALLALLLVLHGVSRRTSMVDMPAMRERGNVASLWESLTFRWMWPTVRQALLSDRLEAEDCADVYWADNPAKAYRRFQEMRARGYGLAASMFRTCRGMFFGSIFLNFMYFLSEFLLPAIVNLFLQFLQRRAALTETETDIVPDGQSTLTFGYLLCTALFAATVLRMEFECHATYLGRRAGWRIMTLIGMVVPTTLLASTQPATQVANAVNLIAADARRMGLVIGSTPMMSLLIVRLLLALAFLVGIMGWLPILAGCAVLAVTVPCNMWLAAQVKKTQKDAVKATDQRLAVVAQVLEAIRLVKVQVWESLMQGKIDALRIHELALIVRSMVWTSTLAVLASNTPAAVTIVAFFVRAWQTHLPPMTPADVFTALYLFYMLDWPMRYIPETYGRVFVTGKIAWNRIRDFVEESMAASAKLAPEQVVTETEEFGLESAVLVRSPIFKLSVSTMFPRGQLSVILGPMGAGKTSLLMGLLGELPIETGRLHRPGDSSMALVEQTVFILNASLRDNVTFGKPYDSARFSRVMANCALTQDLATLADGDLTLIGDRGVNLSGGQRQRLALARALYADTDIILADDVLSAVDAVTASHLYHRALVPAAHKYGKTVVLVSHAVSLALSNADHVVVLDAGVTTYAGPAAALAAEQVRQWDAQWHETANAEPEPGTTRNDGPVRAEEFRSTGSVQWAHYQRYLRAFGMPLAVGALGAVATYQWLTVRADLYLKDWAAGAPVSALVLFAALRGTGIFVQATQLVVQYLGSYRASRRLHHELVAHVLALPIWWFDANPQGRVLTRFSKDFADLDSSLVTDFVDLARQSMANVAAIFAILITAPIVMVFAFPAFLAMAWVGKCYLRTSRDTRRMASTAFAPVVQATKEFHTGGACIRAFGRTDVFTAQLSRTMMQSLIPTISNTAANRWLIVFGDTASALFLFTLALGFLVLPIVKGGPPMDAAWAGFALNYALIMIDTVRLGVWAYSTVEVEMNSVERIGEYLALTTEEDPERRIEDDVPGWPTAGPLVVENLCAGYKRRGEEESGDVEWVLKGVSLTVPAGARVAIMGRTGSGKSSLVGALMRMLPFQSGKIELDGVPVTELSLQYLRSQWGFVNQGMRRRLWDFTFDPITDASEFVENYLLKGTLRDNLDPTGTRADADLHALLDPFRAQLPFGLDHPLDSLTDLSKGQAQLIGLLRSLVAAHAKHQDATVLMIAHRVRSLVDLGCDLAIVMDSGRVVEMGHPNVLLQNADGWLTRLVREAGGTDAQEESCVLFTKEEGRYATVHVPRNPEVTINKRLPAQLYVPKSWQVTPVADKVKDETAIIFENKSAKPVCVFVTPFKDDCDGADEWYTIKPSDKDTLWWWAGNNRPWCSSRIGMACVTPSWSSPGQMCKFIGPEPLALPALRGPCKSSNVVTNSTAVETEVQVTIEPVVHPN
ncbi:Multidrug resistance-associated protein 1 [Allomyces arbusculus]|nr:Multidrug resistance-associated protein 1 [Allomyces arbusculus]